MADNSREITIISAEIDVIRDLLKDEILQNKKQQKLIEVLTKLVDDLHRIAKADHEIMKEEVEVNTEQGIVLSDFSHKYEKEHENIRDIKRMIEKMESRNPELYGKVLSVVEKVIEEHAKLTSGEKLLTPLQRDITHLIAMDHTLKPSQRHIINYLLTKEIPDKDEFAWTLQSDIIKRAHLNRTHYREYFNQLLARNFIEVKKDGQNILFRIHPQFIRKEVKVVEKSLNDELAELESGS